MANDFRELCIELLDELDMWSSWHDAPELKARVKAALNESRPQSTELTQIALKMLGTIENMELIIPEITDTIRKALEQQL
jgi:hypothetical protein